MRTSLPVTFVRRPLIPIGVGVFVLIGFGWHAACLTFAAAQATLAAIELILNATGRLAPQWAWPTWALTVSIYILISPLWS